MIYFASDYQEGMHPAILKRLMDTNMEQTPGYGEDLYCDAARQKIKTLLATEDADVHFLVGGTQTNTTVIAAALRPYQGVISASTGHINVHETGAIEATGHKVLALPAVNGKINAVQVRDAMQAHLQDESREHMVQPAMVYISQPTENGTLYTKQELIDLHRTCREYGLYLFMDGARLGYGMASLKNDIAYSDLCALTDVFYIGGTKVGAMFGEAVVIVHPAIRKDFRYMIKQRGGMLAKGRLLGLQFDTLFTDGLYDRISLHAIRLAMELKDEFIRLNIPLLYDSYTNQQYPIFPNEWLEKLNETFTFSTWQKMDEAHTAVRVCTSWGTKLENVNALVTALNALAKA